mgnify:CR=1 FL=1
MQVNQENFITHLKIIVLTKIPIHSQDIAVLSDRNLRLYKQVLVIIITDHVISILEVIESLALCVQRMIHI